MEPTPVSIKRQMDTEDVVYTCSGILLILIKKGNPAICNNMVKSGGKVREINQTQKGKYDLIPRI